MLCLKQAAAGQSELAELRAELITLRDHNRRLIAENELLRSRLGDLARKKRYTPTQQLRIRWHMAYYGIPRKRVKEHFLIARSTLYRWLHAAETGVLGEERPCQQSSRKTPAQISKIMSDILPMLSGDWTPLAALRAGL